MTPKKHQPAAQAGQLPKDHARRSLLGGLWLGLGGLALAEILWLTGSFLKPLRSGDRPLPADAVIDAGPATQFTPNTVTAFPQGRFYLACLEDGGFMALSRRCTHLGCTVPWDPEKRQFGCPCHASVFDIRGMVIRSPAPRPLDRFAVTIENGRIRVDTGRPIQRRSFDRNQVVYR